MRQFRVAVLIVAATLATLAGCAQTESTSTAQRSATPTSSSPTAPVSPNESPSLNESSSPTKPSSPKGSTHEARTGTVLKTDSSDFGAMLFDRTGQAIYLFDRETGRRPRCYGACADAWPPVLTDGLPRATGDVRSGLLGTTRREDGSTQVTYADHPLYYYAHEGKNEVLCHNVSQFGGRWLVVTPRGEPAA